MPPPTIRITLVMLGLGWLLAACGQGTAVSPTVSSLPPAPAAPSPTLVAPTLAPTSAPATVPPVAAPLAPTPATAGRYAGIPQGTTPEGYQYLGDPAAPLTLVMYSDFL